MTAHEKALRCADDQLTQAAIRRKERRRMKEEEMQEKAMIDADVVCVLSLSPVSPLSI